MRDLKLYSLNVICQYYIADSFSSFLIALRTLSWKFLDMLILLYCDPYFENLKKIM